jgi:putative intracellular protease/amidase
MLKLFLILTSSFLMLSAQAERVLIVVTNHATIEVNDQPTGYYFSEVSHPWKVFTAAGYQVDFASPAGGFAPMDPKSFDLEDPVNLEFWHTLDAVEGLVHTLPLGEIEPNRYAAIFFAGGHGTMWDFPNSPVIRESITGIYEAGGVVGAVCHGPAALIGVEIDGQPLVQGKRIAAFTNQEEAAVDLTETMPFLLETELRELGADIQPAPDFAKNVAVDQRLVTGQNPASATEAAKMMTRLLGD